jgi:hypothetical protein
MKNLLLIVAVFSLQFTTPQKSSAQVKKAIPLAIASAAIAGVIYASNVEAVKGSLERQMVEWILKNRNFNGKKTFDLKLLSWNAAKKEDLSNVSLVVYSYSEFGKLPTIFFNVLSPGWVNDFGIDFAKVRVIEINQDIWSSLIIKYLNMAHKSNMPEITDIETIPAFDRKGKMHLIPFYLLIGLTSSGIDFSTDLEYVKFYFDESYEQSTHVIEDFDENIMLDLNDGDLKLYLKSTTDLITIKKGIITEITKVLFVNKIPVTVY